MTVQFTAGNVLGVLSGIAFAASSLFLLGFVFELAGRGEGSTTSLAFKLATVAVWILFTWVFAFTSTARYVVQRDGSDLVILRTILGLSRRFVIPAAEQRSWLRGSMLPLWAYYQMGLAKSVDMHTWLEHQMAMAATGGGSH
ncbi:MAG: hypothetical protein MUE83_04520 [Tabrizicola sp.]|jgi:hypothetical protein|nr:hypothetical protein [Tabrizicola sp.]